MDIPVLEKRMFNITTKFELNLQKATPAEASMASTYAVKNRVPAVVVSPELFLMSVNETAMKRAQYKIIVAVDFEHLGKNYALDKIRDLPEEIIDADGFDILLTPKVTMIETNNEMKSLTTFLKQRNPLAEIRWVVGFQTWESETLESVLSKAKDNPASYIRTDPNCHTPIDIEKHHEYVDIIKGFVATPIKLSGNIDWKTLNSLKDKVGRFDVTVSQARSIITTANNPNNEEQLEMGFMKEQG